MNLVPVLIKIKNENLIDRVFAASGNDRVLPAYEFAKKQLEQAINNSEDEIVVNRRR